VGSRADEERKNGPPIIKRLCSWLTPTSYKKNMVMKLQEVEAKLNPRRLSAKKYNLKTNWRTKARNGSNFLNKPR